MDSIETEEDKEFLAPENFAMVETGVYRSAFPRTKNIDFLRRLHLKTVISLVPEDYPTAMQDFYAASGIRLLSHGLEGNKWPFKEIDLPSLRSVLEDILDPANQPLLIHCNKGKHRTGSVVGCLRKARGWALSAIFSEYVLFAAPKFRLEDQMLIESFSCDGLQITSETKTATATCADAGTSNYGDDIGGDDGTNCSGGDIGVEAGTHNSVVESTGADSVKATTVKDATGTDTFRVDAPIGFISST